MQGQVDTAVAGLQRLSEHQPQGWPKAHLLLCRAYYSEDLADAAVDECEAAMNGLSGSSEAQDWLGRACGQKAQNAGLHRRLQARAPGAGGVRTRRRARPKE